MCAFDDTQFLVLVSLHHHAKVAASYEESLKNAQLDYYDLVSGSYGGCLPPFTEHGTAVANALAPSFCQH
jgi:hypothetical protein